MANGGSGSQELAAIVLAAGASSRLGQPKQLLRYRGEPLVTQTARLALAAGAAPVVVVLGAAATECRTALKELNVSTVLNAAYQAGMGGSLAVGMAEIERLAAQPARVLVLVCDQPLLTPQHLAALLALPGQLAAAAYSGRVGVPAIFGRQYFPALAAACGDQGMRDLLRAHRGAVAELPLPEAQVDLDTPEDWLRLKADSI